MAFLQTLDPFCQSMGGIAIAPVPYTIDPFCQPLTEEVVPPPPPIPPAAGGGGGGGARLLLPPLQCPPGMYWDPVTCRCCPLPAEPLPDPEAPERPGVSASEARTVATAIGLTIHPPLGYEVLAAEIALKLAEARDQDDED